LMYLDSMPCADGSCVSRYCVQASVVVPHLIAAIDSADQRGLEFAAPAEK
jgi:hypothetical protein